MAKLTPMQEQYRQIKSENEDCLLFFRLGDFYEMFDDDARTASRELELALTTRDRGKPVEEQTPMCGVPYHSCEAYIGRLIARGYKVAICEQMGDPKAGDKGVYGVVDRAVVRIITPGTVTDGSMLDESRSNYLAAVFLEGKYGAVAFCDISTGEFCLSFFDSESPARIVNELGKFSPREVIINQNTQEDCYINGFLKSGLKCRIQCSAKRFDYTQCAMYCCAQFNVHSVDALGLSEYNHSVCAAGALLSYISDTQKNKLTHIRGIDIFAEGRFMELDYSTSRNLELCENMRDGGRANTLLSVLDDTKTPMGARLLRSYISRPLTSAMGIRERQDGVEELVNNTALRGEIREVLREIGDMQRIIGRIANATVGARDLYVLGVYMSKIPVAIKLLNGFDSIILQKLKMMNNLSDLCEEILATISEEAPVSVRDGGMICRGFNERLDYFHDVSCNGARMLAELEARERETTGIKKLKVGYNKVFGYYINIPNSVAQETLPETYIRKQTLVSSERYFTEELKELELALISASDDEKNLEFQIFTELREKISLEADRILRTAMAVANVDVLCSFAQVAARNDYCRPMIELSPELHITEGRHPVVEQAQNKTRFVPNDVHMDDAQNRLAIITGPNMAGKSTYMRQTALIVLMAQMGSFVPAKYASVGVVDRVFTRIGASDDLASGQSTFMVEMTEMANIIKNASSQSLLILDEIGRGTSTYDGMAISRAILEHCVDKKTLGAKTMFATHYHELSALEYSLAGVFNCNISAKKKDGKLIFLRKIVMGAADDSYGIEVAKLAGIPEKITKSANKYLRELESIRPKEKAPEDEQISFVDVQETNITKKLQELSVDSLSPLEALNLLYELKKEAEQA